MLNTCKKPGPHVSRLRRLPFDVALGLIECYALLNVPNPIFIRQVPYNINDNATLLQKLCQIHSYMVAS